MIYDETRVLHHLVLLRDATQPLALAPAEARARALRQRPSLLAELEGSIAAASADALRPLFSAGNVSVRLRSLGLLVVPLSPAAAAELARDGLVAAVQPEDEARTWITDVPARTGPTVAGSFFAGVADSLSSFFGQRASAADAGGFEQKAAPWNLDRLDQRRLPLNGVFRHWEDDRLGRDVDVYVLDSGVRATHADFGGRVDLALSRNFFADSEASPDPANIDDDNGHGTFVTSLAAGRTFGVAKNANIVMLRIYGAANSGPALDALIAMDYAIPLVERRRRGSGDSVRRRCVASMSWSGDQSAVVNGAVSKLAEAGCVVAVAAGNDGKDACLFSPSSARHVITVGASDSVADEFATYSNFGSCVEIIAPGSFATGASFASDRGSRTMSGTSMSTPLVAGAAAVALAQHPDADSRDVSLLLPCIASSVVNGAPHGTTNRLLFVPGSGFPEPSTASSSVDNATDAGPGQACSSGTSAASAAAASSRVVAAVVAVAVAVAAGRCGRGGSL
jgi:subtilisin family serine protease